MIQMPIGSRGDDEKRHGRLRPNLLNTMPKRSEIEIALRRLAPRIPPHELGAVVDHAVDSPGLSVGSPLV